MGNLLSHLHVVLSTLAFFFFFGSLLIILESYHQDSVAQFMRRWSTKPEILGSIPSGVGFTFSLFLPLSWAKIWVHLS